MKHKIKTERTKKKWKGGKKWKSKEANERK